MKRIPLGTMIVPANAKQPAAEIPHAEVLREILFAGGERGLTTAELLTSMDVWAVIKAHADQPAVLLEDAQFHHLAARLQGFRWANGTEEMAAFVHAIQTAATVDPNAANPQE